MKCHEKYMRKVWALPTELLATSVGVAYGFLVGFYHGTVNCIRNTFPRMFYKVRIKKENLVHLIGNFCDSPSSECGRQGRGHHRRRWRSWAPHLLEARRSWRCHRLSGHQRGRKLGDANVCLVFTLLYCTSLMIMGFV